MNREEQQDLLKRLRDIRNDVCELSIKAATLTNNLQVLCNFIQEKTSNTLETEIDQKLDESEKTEISQIDQKNPDCLYCKKEMKVKGCNNYFPKSITYVCYDCKITCVKLIDSPEKLIECVHYDESENGPYTQLSK